MFLDPRIKDFIEEITEKYNLDKELESDPLIKERLSDAESFKEKQVIKSLYSTKKNFPSMILKNIIKDYIDKNIPSSILKEELKEKLSIEEDVANQILQSIIENSLIKESIDFSLEDTPDSKIFNKKGLSQELE